MKKLIFKIMTFGILLSVELIATTNTNSLVAPINMGIYNITDTSVRISFKDMSNNEEGFRVSYFEGKQKILFDIQSSDLSGIGEYNYVNLTKLHPSSLYQVSIVAFNKDGESSSLLKYAKTLPSKIIDKNSPPTVNAGEDKSIHLGTNIVIKGVAKDSDGTISSYLWEEGPEVLANTSSFTYTPLSEGIKKLNLTVTDNDGAKAQDSVNIMVIDQNNVVSINDFGAIPDDNKDDTKAIQKALAVNGHITMKRGVYNVHGIVRLNKETVIEGMGSTFLSVLDTSNNGRTSKNILTLSGDKIIIKNLILDGAYTSGNAKEGNNVSSLLHIYDSNNVLLDNVNTLNHASNWWSNFNFSQLNSNHKMDMYHVIYIGFSNNVTIKNMEQLANIKTEGLLIYESDNILIENFKSSHSPRIWTSLNVVASDNITLNNVEVSDGTLNQGGSSINFIANHHFLVKNTKTTTKQGFDISNEIRSNELNTRVTRDTSYGVFDNCHFEGQRALYGYPTINKSEDLVFKNTKFIPTKEGYATWGVRIQKAGKIRFENCTFGNKKYKTYGMIMGDSDKITIKDSTFINPSVGIYIFGGNFGTLKVENNHFIGNNYSPINFYWSKGYGKEGNLQEFLYSSNKVDGTLINNHIYNIKGDFKIDKITE